MNADELINILELHGLLKDDFDRLLAETLIEDFLADQLDREEK